MARVTLSIVDGDDLVNGGCRDTLLQGDDRFLPTKFLRKLTLLFESMSEKDGILGEHSIRYFNGGLFDNASVIKLDVADLGILY